MTGRPFILNSDKIHIITLYSPPASTASNVKFRGEFLDIKRKGEHRDKSWSAALASKPIAFCQALSFMSPLIRERVL